MRDALSLLLTAGGEPLTVVDARRTPRAGLLTLGLLERLLAEDADASDGDAASAERGARA